MKKFVYTVMVDAVLLVLLLLIGEFAMRWYVEGGPVAALRSIGGASQTGYHGADRWLIYDPELGYKFNPARDNVNSLGIRHEQIVVPKPADTWRVVVLGDSVAAAGGGRGFVAMLRDRFDELRDGPVEVINAAIAGYTTYQQRRLLERDLLVVEPDLVILQYCVNDHHKFLHRLDPTGKWLITREAQIALFGESPGWLGALTRSSYLVFELRTRLHANRTQTRSEFPWQDNAHLRPAWDDDSWPVFEDHLRAMRDQLAKIHTPIAVVAVPYRRQINQKYLDLDERYTLKPQRKLAGACRRLGVPLLDLQPAFIEHRDEPLYKDSLHLTTAGHELVCQQLVAFLRAGQLAGDR